MSTHLLGRLGTMDVRGVSCVVYVVLDDGEIVDSFTAANDDEALFKARDLFSDGVVDCEPGLAALAARRGAPVRERTSGELISMAHLALPLLVPETFKGVKQHAAITDLLNTASGFRRAVAPDLRQHWYVAARVSGTVTAESTPIDRDLFFLVLPGPRPSLIVVESADARWMFANGADVLDVDRMAVELGDGPAELVQILHDGYELDAVPRVTVVKERQSHWPNSDLVELLAGCLASITRQVDAKVSGIRFSTRLGGTLAIDLSTFRS